MPTKKKTTKKTAKTAKKKKVVECGVQRSKDVRWCTNKVDVFKALKTLGATSVSKAVDVNKIADKTKIAPQLVRHYCYHAGASELIAIVDLEEVRGYSFYLTKKGSRIDPKTELAKQNGK